MKSLRTILAIAALLAAGAAVADADEQCYKLVYPGGSFPGEFGPGGAKRIVVNLTSAVANRGGPRNETLALSSVVVRWSEPRTCGFPTATINSATQFTLEWPSACANAGQFVFVEVTSSATQGGATGSWKDAGGSEVSPAVIVLAGACPVPAVSPAGAGALVVALLAGGWLAARRRSAGGIA